MVKSIVNTLSTKFFSAVFSFLIILVTSNFLGTDGRGQISLIISSVTIILLFSNFVGGSSLIYLASRKPIGELLIASYLWTLFSISLIFLLLIVVKFFDFYLSLHITLLSTLFSFTSIHTCILLGKEKILTANKISLYQVIAHFFLLSICFILFDLKNISVFILSLYITYGGAFLISAFYIKKLIGSSLTFKINQTLLTAFSVGALAQAANIFQFMNSRLDIYLLKKYDSISHLGIYSTSVSIAEAVLLFSGSFALVQFSKISNLEDEIQSRKLTLKLTRVSTCITLMAYLPLLVFPDEFYTFLLGKGFIHVKSILLALSPGIVALGSGMTLSSFFAGTGKYKMNAMASLAGMCVTIGLGFLFIPRYGIIAAAWVSSISYFVSSLVLVSAFLYKSNSTLAELIPGFSDFKFLQTSVFNVRNNRNN